MTAVLAEQAKTELRGLNVASGCFLDRRCHADNLLAVSAV